MHRAPLGDGVGRRGVLLSRSERACRPSTHDPTGDNVCDAGQPGLIGRLLPGDASSFDSVNCRLSSRRTRRSAGRRAQARRTHSTDPQACCLETLGQVGHGPRDLGRDSARKRFGPLESRKADRPWACGSGGACWPLMPGNGTTSSSPAEGRSRDRHRRRAPHDHLAMRPRCKTGQPDPAALISFVAEVDRRMAVEPDLIGRR